MNATWHADDALMARYVRGEAGSLDGASLEGHLTGCADCRARIATHVDAPPLEKVWSRVREQAQAPRPSVVERLLTRAGMPAPDALLVGKAPSLRASWLLGVTVTLGFAGLGASFGGSRGLAFFLLVAPLVPVAGVAFAYGPDVDPSYEVCAAAPYPAFRLLLLRSSAVLATSLPLVLAASLLLPGLLATGLTAVTWLLPALAFTAVVLAASTWVRPTAAAVGLGIPWACAVGAAALHQDPDAVLAPTLLLVYATVGVAAAFVLGLRTHRLTIVGSLS